MKISIIIKALNEQDNIKRAIESSLVALKELKGKKGEVILADSLSTDNTIKIAKKYPIRIVQLKNPNERSCGIGPQLGYQYAKGTYVYILDGDMEFEKGFLAAAIKTLEKEKDLAGVGGSITEMRTQSITFARRKHAKKTYGEVKRLEMGGLYKRKALDEVGYFSNRNLHAYEEADLGFKLENAGWKLKRIDVPAIKHYGYNTTSFGAFAKRWNTRYVKGAGELLQQSLASKNIFKVLWHLKIYLVIIAWWILFFLSFLTQYTSEYLIATGILLFLFLLKKRSIKEWAYSLVSWHYSAIGLLWGLCSRSVDPKMKIDAKVIK